MSTPELLTDTTHTRGDLQMIQTAIRKGWAIPDHIYEKAGLVISQILAKGSNREKVAAMKCLLAMNEQNAPKTQPTQVVNVGVQIDNRNPDSQRTRTLAIAERIRANRIS